MPYDRPGWIIIRATEQEGYQTIILDGSLAVQQSRGGGGWGRGVGWGMGVGGWGWRVRDWVAINLDGSLAVQQSRGDAIPSAYN